MSNFLNNLSGEKLLIKMWDSLVDQGIGGLLRPRQIREEGKARADVRRRELLVMAQTAVEVQDILAGRKALDQLGQVTAIPPPSTQQANSGIPSTEHSMPSPKDPNSLIAGVRQEVTLRELKRTLNLRKTVIIAEEEAQKVTDEEVSDQPVDPDFIARWRECVQDVSSKEMQQLWARILAGEVKQPGSYCLRTVDLLRNLIKVDAEKIQIVASYRIHNVVVDARKPGNSFLAKVSIEVLLQLDEIGIIQLALGLPSLKTKYASTRQDRFLKGLVCNDKILLVTGEKPDVEFELPVIKVTQVGQELMSLGNFSADIGYLKDVGRMIKSQGFTVQIGDFEKAANAQNLNAYNLQTID